MSSIRNNDSIKKSDVWKMFDNISRTYDITNHVLSFGQDIFWRKSLPKYLNNSPSQVVLDVATGTGDVLLSLVKGSKRIKKAYGIDLSGKMMEIGKNKIQKAGYGNIIELKMGDANNIPFDNGMFDVVTIAFGIRNVENPLRALKEMLRVTKKGGKIIILEFSLPEMRVLKILLVLYLRNMVPLVGGIISGDWSSYSYLNKTVEDFPYGEAFSGIIREAGFSEVKREHVAFGIATIYHGIK